LSLIKDASVRSKPHCKWRRNQVNDEYDNRFKIVEASLSKGHFVQDRLEQKREKVEVVGSVFKKQNVAQSRAKPQHLTPAVTGLIPYSSLVNARNLNDYKIELMHRGVPEDEVPKSIRHRKKMLQELEFERLKAVAGMEDKAARG